jgi:GTP pyrophosphokinase
MHRIAEFGVASHWLYKQGPVKDLSKLNELSIFNKLKDWSGMLASGSEFLDGIKRELLKDSIFVFTPKGDVIELPAKATPLDFAYRVHTQVGNRCYAAKADGVIVPLSSELKNTQVVEIVTSNAAHPNINWLKFVRTSGARSKIRQWLVANGQAIAIEKNVVARKKNDEADRAHERHRGKEEPAKPAHDDIRPPKTHGVAELRSLPVKETLDDGKAGISIEGAKGFVIRFAGCCKPSTGDSIVGYVSRGRGIIVHKRTCPNLPNISEFAERAIEVSWEKKRSSCIKRFRIEAHPTFDLFSEIEGAVKKMGGLLVEGKLDTSGDYTVGFFTLEMESAEEARRAEKNIKSIPSVLKVIPVS